MYLPLNIYFCIHLVGDENCTLMMPDPSSLRRGDSVALFLPRSLHPYERSSLLQLLSRFGCLMMHDSNGPRPLTEAELAYVSPPPPPPPSVEDTEGSSQSSCSKTDKVVQGITAGELCRLINHFTY